MYDVSTPLTFGTQIRKSPFFNATLRFGCKSYSVYNHMYIPRSFGDPVQNYWNLINNAILCDVSVERQVEITGPDADHFVQYLTPRNLTKCNIGQCKYVLITSEDGGIINDPVLLKLDKNHFWLSISDSDVLLWAKGVKTNLNLNVNISEPDVSPLQLQGPKSNLIMKSIFGDWIDDIKYYRHIQYDFKGIPLLISRTGWSSEFGYEIFLRDGKFGDELWEIIMNTGIPLGLCPGHTSTIRRIEGAMLSYIADMNINNNPYEMGLEYLVDLEMEQDFIGKKALKKIKNTGVKKKLCGFKIHGPPLIEPTDSHISIFKESAVIGSITSGVYSPRLNKNIALGIVDVEFSEIGTVLEIKHSNIIRKIIVIKKPFYDPSKKLVKGN